MNTVTISIISIFVSALSATIAFLSFTSSRAELIFFRDDDLKPLAIVNSEIFAKYTDHSGKEQRIPFPNGILYHIQVFNPSPQDIAFFHMEFIVDKEIHRDVWTLKTLGWATDRAKIVMNDLIHGPGEIFIPTAPQGVFKAHSFTPLYLFVTTDGSPFPKHLSFQFKYAVRSFPYFGKKHRYKLFVRDLDLSNVKLEMTSKQEAMKQLTSPVQKSLKSKQTPPYSKRRKHNRRKK
ncbi:hypothetical protein [Limosilactobacillus vaginalis]|uniref:hypothetical protein n=1 Tax=Limosilactobacillus vaginalis TaxID=1633 RepID=UPI0024BBBCE4|nr:hypothetical protein [Limosilactobacillus vaginalis]